MFKRAFVASVTFTTLALFTANGAQSKALLFADEGPTWGPAESADFYTRDQGSRIMPLSWMKALTINGQPFLADSLARYGYLSNPAPVAPGLPVGFVTGVDGAGRQSVGMTCSACHTRQISFGGTDIRIDGGPAIADFRQFLVDIDASVTAALATDDAFNDFARTALGHTPSTGEKAKLRTDVTAWEDGFHVLVDRAVKDVSWGPARLDAVSMIFNRLTGLDIGRDKAVIPDNIYRADAPVRYPFLWNASRQDYTQWPGFAQNGNDLLALGRNVGEVIGVFGEFHPHKIVPFPPDAPSFGSFIKGSSFNFPGLQRLETLIQRIQPPKWPGTISTETVDCGGGQMIDIVACGKKMFEQPVLQGDPAHSGCQDCHFEHKSTEIRPLARQEVWATPRLDVGTDTREYDVLGRTVNTGGLKGLLTNGFNTFGEREDVKQVLVRSVVGVLLQSEGSKHPPRISLSILDPARADPSVLPLTPDWRDLIKDLFPPTPEGKVYEARVLHGIWATAPYLHNGSVSSLAELLKTAAERKVSFQVGPEYDTANVGLAEVQTTFNYTMTTTDCSDRNSGNSRCGHEYGTGLTEVQKRALVEYLKRY
jgi:hypothetical protein